MVYGTLPPISETLKNSKNDEAINLDKHGSWAFFNEAYREQDFMIGPRCLLFLIDSHYFMFKANGGCGTNNFGEFNALYYLLKLAQKFYVIY